MPGEATFLEGDSDAVVMSSAAAAPTSAAAATAVTSTSNKDKEKDGLWKSILQDVAASTTTTRHLPPKNVLVLGDEGSGKSSFISRLQGRRYNADDQLLGTGLEYTYLDVRDEETEDIIGRLGIYTLDGDAEHAPLMKFVCSEDTLSDTTFLFVVDFSRPWTIMESLEKWFAVVEKHVKQFEGPDANTETELSKLQAANKAYFQRYSDPTLNAGGNEEADANGEPEGGEGLLPLEEGVLTTNLGVPLVIVVNKADAMPSLRKDRDFQGQHFDFIQLKIRDFAMRYGAAVIYNSKDSSNRETVYRYMLHRAYGFPFKESADISKPDALFIPSAWDSPVKISVLNDGLKTIQPTDNYAEHITPPIQPEADETEVHAQDEQSFLKQQQSLLGRPVDENRRQNLAFNMRSGAAESTIRATRTSISSTKITTSESGAGKAASLTGTKGAPAAGAPSGAAAGADAAKGGGQNTDVLANFFNSLLAKNPSTKERKDASAALDSMTGGEPK